MEAKVQRMDWEKGIFVNVKEVVLEIGQRVYGVLGYGGSESGTFIVASEPDGHKCQLLLEVGGRHRKLYWKVGQDDQPISKKFGIGLYWDDKEPDYRMPHNEIEKLRRQCEIQKRWNERKERNATEASRKRTEGLRKQYNGILTECKRYDRDIAKKNMMVMLKREFPGVRFYCKKSSWKSYSLRWEDGPMEEAVEKVCRPFVDTYFDGMQDMEESCGDEFTDLFGGIGYMPYTERTYSEAVWKQAETEFYEAHPEAAGIGENAEFTPKTWTKFTKGYSRIYTPNSCIRLYLSGKDLYVKPEKKDKPAKVEYSGKLEIIDYSEKAIALIGDTKPLSDKLKKLGGKFNGKLRCGAGWIFSKKHENEVRAAFAI